MSRRSRYVPPVWTAPSDPTDLSQMPLADPARPWSPISQTPEPGNYGIVLPTGEPSAAFWNGATWRNGYAQVQAIAWRAMPDFGGK